MIIKALPFLASFLCIAGAVQTGHDLPEYPGITVLLTCLGFGLFVWGGVRLEDL